MPDPWKRKSSCKVPYPRLAEVVPRCWFTGSKRLGNFPGNGAVVEGNLSITDAYA